MWDKELTDLYQNGDYDKCARVCFENLYKKLDDALCWYILGMSLRNLNRAKEAIVALKTALSIDEGLIEPLIPLAEALLAEGKVDEAKHWIEKYLLHDKNNINARYIFAECLRKGDKLFEAIESLRESIHMTGLNSPIDVQLCQSFSLAVEAIERENRQKIGGDRDSASYIEELGFHHTDGLNVEIKDYLEQLIVNAPHMSGAHVFLGAYYSSEGQFELAEKHFNKAYQLDSQQDRAHTVRLCDSYFDTLNKISVGDMASKLPNVHWEDGNFYDDQPVVFISCDYNYFFTFAIAFINSIRHNSAGINLHLHLMNPDFRKKEIRNYIDKIDNIRINFSYEVVNPSLTKKDFLRCYYITARFFRLYQCMLRYKLPIMILDVDGLVLKHLNHVFEYVKGNDIGFRMRPGRFDPWNQVSAGAVVINPTEIGIEYLELVAKYVGTFALEEKSSWMLDQMSLFSTLKFFQRNHHINVKLLDKRIFSCRETTDPVIFWTAGQRKFSQAKQAHGRWSEGEQVDTYTRLLHKYKDLYDSPSVLFKLN